MGDHVQDIVTKAGKRVDILAFLMYRLDRNTLEIIHKTLIRSILEYGDVLFCNMAEEQSQMIALVNKRAGSIISGAIRDTSSNIIYNELGWVTMESRRKFHRLVTLHKIINGKTPDYLRNCPAIVRDWNAPSPNVRNIVDHEKLREALAKEMPCRNKLYSYGHRKTSILHTRIRMGCSALTGHLYNYHVVENPRCDYGGLIPLLLWMPQLQNSKRRDDGFYHRNYQLCYWNTIVWQWLLYPWREQSCFWHCAQVY